MLGWSNIPDARGVFSRAEFSYELNINSLGLRGAEITPDKPAGIRRVAVLGDSFVWGIGAADDELFTTLLAGVAARNTGTELRRRRLQPHPVSSC